jgi:acyl dehydratase
MTIQPPTIGAELPLLRIEPISRKLPALFASASGDHHPTHIDIDLAKAKGRDDMFAHGMLMMDYLGRMVTDLAPQEKVRSLKARLVAIRPVYAEPTRTGRVIGVENGLATLELAINLADGKTVVATRQ